MATIKELEARIKELEDANLELYNQKNPEVSDNKRIKELEAENKRLNMEHEKFHKSHGHEEVSIKSDPIPPVPTKPGKP